MPGGNNKLRPEDNPKPFTKDNLPTDEMRKKAGLKNTRNRNFVSKLVELLNNDGELILPKKILIDEIKGVDEKEYFVFKIPNIDSIVIKWILDAQSGKSNIRTRSRETLIERIEGKAMQPFQLENNEPEINLEQLTKAERQQWYKLLDKALVRND